MTEAKFTKGPWVWVKDHDGEEYLSSNGEEVLTSRWEGGSFTSLGVDAPDKHLIAAAPDLYEALSLLLDNCKSLDDSDLSEEGLAMKRAMQALAKARGES